MKEEYNEHESRIAQQLRERIDIQLYPNDLPPLGGRCDEWYS